MTLDNNKNKEAIHNVPEVPKRSLSTYARLWQLETWLRRMVYVELRALLGDDWNSTLPKAEGAFKWDKRLIHMPTPEMNALSYAPISALKKAIEQNSTLFESYLPPSNIWQAKLEEVEQIRHRVAHFRLGHEDDLQRVVQFLRDLDQGFWRFCTSYNNPRPVLPPETDPLVTQFLHLDPFPWTEVGHKKWARVGSADPDLIVAVTVEILQRPWAKTADSADGTPGYLYDVHIHARGRRYFSYEDFLEGINAIHHHFVHVCLGSVDDHIRLTIPAVLGSHQIINAVERCIDVATNVVSRSHWRKDAAQQIADEWPEYVLGPENPLDFLAPGMKCSFFGV